ncbi:MAG: 50S ribosomal protein L1 [Candidatus Aenigmatarchaeota archaeon]
MKEKILKAIGELRNSSKKRGFSQTFDLIVSLKEFDIKKTENKFTEDVILPYGRGEDAKIVVFSDTIKDLDCEILRSGDIERYSKNKREAKTLVKNTDFFFAEPKLMVLVGKAFGQFMGPKGKLPKIITGDIEKIVKDYKKAVRIRIKDAPVIQCAVGRENMKDEEVAENVEAVLKAIQAKLPRGIQNIKTVWLKFTMGKPVKVEV